MKFKSFNTIMLFVGSLILLFLLSTLDLDYLKNFNFTFTFFNVFILVLIIFLIFFIRTLRWMRYLKSIEIDIGFVDAYFIVVVSIGLALFTPAQSGDVIKIELLKKKKKTLRRDSFATVFVEKLMDFLVIFIIFVIATAYYSLQIFNLNYQLIFVILVLGSIFSLIASFYLYKKYKSVRKIVDNILKILVDFKTLIYTLFLTLLYWIIVCFNWIYVAQITNIEISFFQMLGVLSIGTILGLLSFVPGALGVMEYTTMLLLSTFMGIPAQQAVVFALSYRVYTVFMYFVVYVHLFFRKL